MSDRHNDRYRTYFFLALVAFFTCFTGAAFFTALVVFFADFLAGAALVAVAFVGVAALPEEAFFFRQKPRPNWTHTFRWFRLV